MNENRENYAYHALQQVSNNVKSALKLEDNLSFFFFCIFD